MKSMRASILFVAVLLIFASLPVQAKDGNKLTFFGFDQVYKVVSEGEVTIHPSGSMEARGIVQEGFFYLFVPDRGLMPLPGVQTTETNYNINAPNSSGVYWGKWSIDFGEYGYFEGRFSGNLIPFLDHANNFDLTTMLIGQNSQLQGTFHGADGDEEWLIKTISVVAQTGADDDGADYFGEITVK
jgi:hypothetical protein